MNSSETNKLGDIRSRNFSTCADIIWSNREVVVNYGELLEKLILFDKYIFQSIRLKEIPHFIEVFGYDATLELFSLDSIDLHHDHISMASMNSQSKRNFSYTFNVVRSEHESTLSKDIAKLKNTLEFETAKFKSLETKLLSKVVKYPKYIERELYTAFFCDLTTKLPVIKTALKLKLKEHLKKNIDPSGIELSIDVLGAGKVEVETNINVLFKIDTQVAHNLIESVLLAIGGLNQRILQMKVYNAITCFSDLDMPVFDEKLGFIEDSLSPDSQIRRFHQVLTIKDFPDLNEAAKNKSIDLIKLIKLRDSREIEEFRKWLWNLDSMSDSEMKEQVAGIKSTLSNFIHGSVGKKLRWVATTGLGYIPPVGSVLGTAASVLDTFLLEKVFPESGAITFINRLYPSIFKM